MGAITGKIHCQTLQCLLCYAAGYEGLSTSSWANQVACMIRDVWCR
jgi:hypothetical protein